MSDEIAYDQAFCLYGYERAVEAVVDEAKQEIEAGVSIETVIIRSHLKLNNLRRLQEGDSRVKTKRQKKRK